jgi:hypothetical protein
MRNNITYNVFFAAVIALSCLTIQAQNLNTINSNNPDLIETNKRQENYNKLKSLGYKEREIYEDLGNANFLSENYETALFWYAKLFEFADKTTVSNSYYERYTYSIQMTDKTAVKQVVDKQDWVAKVKSDYEKKDPRESKYHAIDFNGAMNANSLEAFIEKETNNEQESKIQDGNAPQIAVSVDGKTAYYTKAVYVKPLYGVFSKKELVHKIYKAEKISGQWKTINEVALGPKNSSTMHPAISEDGKRLFFASDMPGTFGKFDIYVADIRNDGTYGVAKNLGQKVNTNENDLYPNIVGGTSLFFASNGHKGFGGLDVFMVEVANNKVGWTVNLGSPINSNQDDFSISIINEKGVGYVTINRGNENGAAQRVAYSYSNPIKTSAQDKKDDVILEAFNTDSKINYASSIFEDK